MQTLSWKTFAKFTVNKSGQKGICTRSSFSEKTQAGDTRLSNRSKTELETASCCQQKGRQDNVALCFAMGLSAPSVPQHCPQKLGHSGSPGVLFSGPIEGCSPSPAPRAQTDRRGAPVFWEETCLETPELTSPFPAQSPPQRSASERLE